MLRNRLTLFSLALLITLVGGFNALAQRGGGHSGGRSSGHSSHSGSKSSSKATKASAKSSAKAAKAIAKAEAKATKASRKAEAKAAKATRKDAARSDKCLSCPRERHGRIKRNPQAKSEFRKTHPCPSGGNGGCKGYVIDHIRPLAEGGADDPSTMQWQTTSAAKAKDKTERKH